MDGIQRAPETGLVKTDLANGIGIVSDRQTSKGAADGPVVSSSRPAAHKAAHNAAHRAIAVITGGSERVPQSSYIEALTSKRYLMWAAEAASSRIADIDEGPDGHDRLVLVTAYGGEIHDYGNRIEIPERTSDGHRVEDLANADAIYKTLAVLAARLAIVKGWTRAEISPQNSAFFVRAFESLVSAGVQLPSKGHAKSDGDVIKAASEWHRPHWNRVQITDKQRHDWLGALVGKMPEPGRRSRDPIPYKADGGHGVAQPTPKGRGAGSGTTGDQNAPARGGIPVGREQLVADAKDALDIGAAAPDQ